MWYWALGGGLLGALLGSVSALYSLWRQAQRIGELQESVGELRHAFDLERRRADELVSVAKRQEETAHATRQRLEAVIRGQHLELARWERTFADLAARYPDLMLDRFNALGRLPVSPAGGSGSDGDRGPG